MSFARNDPCPCGSLKKFKACCLGKEKDLSQVLLAKLIESIAKEKALAIQLAEAMDLYRKTKYRYGILFAKLLMIGPMFSTTDIADQVAPVLYRFIQERGPDDKWPLHSEAKIDLEANGDVYISVPAAGGHERIRAGNVNDKPSPIEKTPVAAVARMRSGEIPIIVPHKRGSGCLIKDVLRNKEAIDQALNVPAVSGFDPSNDAVGGLVATLDAYHLAKKKEFTKKGVTP